MDSSLQNNSKLLRIPKILHRASMPQTAMGLYTH